jgi:hypothetical protein
LNKASARNLIIGAGGIGDDTVARAWRAGHCWETRLNFFVKMATASFVDGLGFFDQKIQFQQLRQGSFHHAAQVGNSRVADMKNILRATATIPGKY